MAHMMKELLPAEYLRRLGAFKPYTASQYGTLWVLIGAATCTWISQGPRRAGVPMPYTTPVYLTMRRRAAQGALWNFKSATTQKHMASIRCCSTKL